MRSCLFRRGARSRLSGERNAFRALPLEELLPRLSGPGRPLAKDAAVLFAQRWEGYHSTGSLVDVSGCSPQEAATRVLARLEAA